MDEARFIVSSKLSKVWALKGTKPLVKTNCSRKGISVTGAYDEYGEFTCRFSDKGNALEFIEFLKVLMNRYENFLLIPDNAPIHKAGIVRKFAEENKGRFEILYLPPYSPELNATEECWRQTRICLTNNKLFSDLDDLKMSLEAFFAEHKFSHDLFSYLGR
jgi:putative transposase